MGIQNEEKDRRGTSWKRGTVFLFLWRKRQARDERKGREFLLLEANNKNPSRKRSNPKLKGGGILPGTV